MADYFNKVPDSLTKHLQQSLVVLITRRDKQFSAPNTSLFNNNLQLNVRKKVSSKLFHKEGVKTRRQQLKQKIGKTILSKIGTWHSLTQHLNIKDPSIQPLAHESMD